MTTSLNLVHFAALPLVTGVVTRRQKPEGAVKPEGLWLSVEGDGDGWSDWCKSERFHLDDLAVAHQIELADDAVILRLSSPDEIDLFTVTYSMSPERCYWLTAPERIGYYIDWRRVATEYQGIIIAPYVWERRLTLHTHWYYGWDCASGCIWDSAAVRSVEVLAECEMTR
jgi:hypothetical protein